MAVVATKIDLREEERKKRKKGESLEALVEKEEGEPVAAESSVDFYETSAKETTGVEAAFTSLIAKVVRCQLQHEAEEKERGEGGGEGEAKKKKRFKNVPGLKKLVQGGKKIAKCTVS